ncbi:tyrosine-type recombinase/integrase [Pseudonocardia spinosispora]|uniref:tyrosine-type recombinase/integrase n=1 Tax=Pseudonocardia spinosispora TaxID=103441 RepID=UPI00041F5321|nr:site-specific integrase [Pseudonocardia spinosispora]
MIDGVDEDRDLSALVVPRVGTVEVGDDLWEPVRLIDSGGEGVAAVMAFLRELQASGRSAATQRSYAMDLLRWFRFVWAIGVSWDQVTRVEARDFCRWLGLRDKPTRAEARPQRVVPNPVTGKPGPGPKYAAATRAHSETVLRVFYDFHRDAGTGPMVNPFPQARERRGSRANAHHNPMEPFRNERVGLYRPRGARRIPRAIPDELFSRVFAQLGSHRDRALVALWVSTGARAAELLGARCGDVDPGQQLITVIRKGTRAIQQLPASPDAFVWLRLYQAGHDQALSAGRDDPLWWTRRRPFRALTYPAARAMFGRAAGALGANWTLHDLRHTAAYRMARDPQLPLTDVQWVLGHAHLSTTQRYLTPMPGDVIAGVLAHHRRDGQRAAADHTRPTTADTVAAADAAALSSGYRQDSLDVLFGGRTS